MTILNLLGNVVVALYFVTCRIACNFGIRDGPFDKLKWRILE